MVIYYSLENFGSVKKSQVVSFEAKNYDDLEEYFIIEPLPGLRLLKLVFLYGANGSGKTTILRGLEFLRDLVLAPLEKKTETLNYKQFLLDENSRLEDSSMEIAFVSNKRRYVYNIVFNNHCIVTEKLLVYNPKKSTVFERTTDVERQLTSIRFGSKIRLRKSDANHLKTITLWNNSVLGGFLKANVEV